MDIHQIHILIELMPLQIEEELVLLHSLQVVSNIYAHPLTVINNQLIHDNID